MQERTANILEAAIKEFISTGNPVSSGWLHDHYDFGIQPAMIRAELSGLEGSGFLEQPYHSAGRVPTDRGFRFFAELVLERAKPAEPKEDLVSAFFGRAWNEFLGELSSELGMLGVAGDLARGAVYKDGLDSLVGHFETESFAELKKIIHDFEHIDERLASMAVPEGDFIGVFIGRQSPITKSEGLSVVMADYDYNVNGDRVRIAAIGPKRMNYEKTAKIFKGLKNAKKEISK